MADTDLLTLDEAKQAVNLDLDDDDRDDDLAVYVSAVSETIDNLCGNIVARTVVERPRHSGNGVLRLAHPAVSVSSVVEWASNGTSTTLDAEDDDTKPQYGYLLVDGDTVNALLLRRSSGATAYWTIGDRNVVVTYEAGRVESTDDVPLRFKFAAQRMLAAWWRQASAAWARTPDFGTGDQFDDQPISMETLTRELLPDDILGPRVRG